jgi:soluble lytic murein transglycosylase-like protein
MTAMTNQSTPERNTLARKLLLLLILLGMPCLALADDVTDRMLPVTAEPVAQSSASEPDPLSPTVPWLQHIQDAARAYGVDAHLLQAVVKVESNFNPSAVSRSGAIGLMQIMPATAAGFIGLVGSRQSLKQQLHDPVINLHAGALYLRSLMDTFSQRLDLALAAYNAGAGNVRKAGNRVPPNGQTPQFVEKVTVLYASIKTSAELNQAGPALPAATVAAEPPMPWLRTQPKTTE